MSQERVLKTLENFGLSQFDAQVYVFLGKKGPKKARDIVKTLRMPKQQVYIVLKNLQGKGIITATLERPASFSVVPFEKVLDLFVKAKMEEAQQIAQGKADVLSDWQSLAIGETVDTSAKFMVLEGRNYIYSKLEQMIEETKKQFLIISTVAGLVRADQFGLLDAAFNHANKSKAQIRFLTEVSEQNTNVMKSLLKRVPLDESSFEGRVPDLGLKLFTRIVIRDDEEAVFFITLGEDKTQDDKTETCLWTNSKALVQSFSAVFEDLWSKATEVKKRIDTIEKRKLKAKTCVIPDSTATNRQHDEAIREARQEVFMMTSSEGLITLVQKAMLLKEWAKRRVSVKIMAPITSRNLNAAQLLSECCEVKHVPTSYLNSTVVDGRHLFQFKNPPTSQEKIEAMSLCEDSFYSNDLEYVEKTKDMLKTIWDNSQPPSAITLDLVNKAPEPIANSHSAMTIPKTVKKFVGPILVEDEKLSEELTEKDILNRIINSQENSTPLKGISRFYGSFGQAIIHPPRQFDLPETVIHILHYEKQSTNGAQDAMIISLGMETPKGHAYVPTAFVGDNPDAICSWKKIFAGIPFEQNIQLVGKDQLQIRVHNNILFAGWTIQIPLLHPPYTFPPSALLLEGHGKVKTSTYSVDHPSGYKVIHEYNGFEAFVTYLHPLSKYAGPGTDGFFGRDTISTVYPP